MTPARSLRAGALRAGCVLLALTALTCGSRASSTAGAAQSASGAPRVQTPFERSSGAFRAAVARAYQLRASELTITPSSSDVVGFEDEDLGELLGFEARAPNLRVRGLASASEVVLAQRGDYAPLFRAAHALDAATALAPNAVAQRVTWLLGPEKTLVSRLVDYPRYPLPKTVSEPTWEPRADGVALRFFYLVIDVHGAPAASFEVEVTCSHDYRTTLVTRPGP